MTTPIEIDSALQTPFEWVPVPVGSDATLPEALRERVFIHTVHDGAVIPASFVQRADGSAVVDPRKLERAFVRERDWGANLVAKNLARELGLGGYARVTVARALLDFNRFPGTTPPGTKDPMNRLAISAPFAGALRHADKMALLDLYDEISRKIETFLVGKLLILGVHTYDEHNPSQTSRPHLSLVTQPAGYQRDARMPFGVFDPLYPDRLAESTSSRILRDRISLDLERAGFRVSGNHPYALPEGSIEVRSQVWFFFRELQRRFAAAYPETADDDAYALVWRMLLDTNLRDGQADELRGHVHRYRKVASRQVAQFGRAVAGYANIAAFLRDSTVEADFRRAAERPSSLALEVRKDLLCEIDPTEGRPKPPTTQMRERADRIAKVFAAAVATYFRRDGPGAQLPIS